MMWSVLLAVLTVINIAIAGWCPEDIAPQSDDCVNVPKCCFKGQQLDATGTVCVVHPGSDVEKVSTETISFMDDAPYWLPNVFDNSTNLRVWYNRRCYFNEWLSAVLEADNETVTSLLNIDSSVNRFELAPFKGRVQPWAVWRQHFCLDASANSSRPLVAVTTLQLRTLFKCCERSHELDSEGVRCVLRPGQIGPDTEKEVLNPWESPDSVYWLPSRLTNTIIEVFYDKGPEIQGNPKNDAEDVSAWALHDKSYSWSYMIRVPTADLNSSTSGNDVTGSFCFDTARQEGSLPAKVLVTKVGKINKCCRPGMRLDVRAMHCEALPDTSGKQTGRVSEEVQFLGATAASEALWLPPALRRPGAPVRLLDARTGQAMLSSPQRQTLPAPDGPAAALPWRLETFDYDVPQLSIQARTPTGGAVVARARHFCLDAVAPGPLSPRVLVADVCGTTAFACLPKCCPAGELLSPGGRCEGRTLPGLDWTPLASPALRPALDPHAAYGGSLVASSLCWAYRFELHLVPGDARDFLGRLLNNSAKFRFLTKYYCADFLRTSDSTMETLASCTIPPSGPLYEKIRPLQVVAALLLAASTASLLWRKETRVSMHGRALAAHAGCLAASNGLQALWFFTNSYIFSYCEIFGETDSFRVMWNLS